MSKGRLEASITVPTGGWAGTIDDSGGGGAAAWTVAAGTYFLSGDDGLLAVLEDALNLAATTDTLTVTCSVTESGTGKVSITSSGAGTLAWTDTDLRDLLGYDANLTLVAATANTASAQARSLWRSDCAYDAPNTISPWVGWIEADAGSTESRGGDVFSISGQYRQATWLRWEAVARSRASQANESTVNESFERFVRDGVWGFASWGTPGGNIRFFPSADSSDWVEYAVNLSEFREFKPELFVERWTGGPWMCGFKRLVYQDDSGTTAPTPTFVAAGTPVCLGTAITVAWPTHQTDDIALLIFESDSSEAVTLATPAGFVEIPDSPQDAGVITTGTRLTVFWCRATSAAMASPVTNDSGNHQLGVILTFRGCAPTGDPWDVTAGDTNEAGSTAVSIPGDTTTGGNRLIVAICSHATDVAIAQFSAWANASLTSITERLDTSDTPGNGGGLGVATGEKVDAGAYSATTATLATSSPQARISIALKG